EIFREQIEQTVLVKMDQLVYEYYQDALTEDETRVFLSRVGKFGFADRHITECTDLIKAKDVSRAAYAAGEAHLAAQEYAEAVQAFRQVREQDAQYDAAQDAIALCRTVYGDRQLERAREMLSANNKNGARQAAEELIDLFGTYPTAEEFLTSFTLTAE
ncbi:MAG: hypothetical protein J6X30_01795, partial [Clostridia bacterium]|nr:hypothetical protein [Clostridia bacterium]